MSCISKVPLTKKQKICIASIVSAVVLILAVVLTVVGVLHKKAGSENRWATIQAGVFCGELSIKNQDGDNYLTEKQNVKLVVSEISKAEYEQSGGIGTVKDAALEQLDKDKYFKIELYVEKDGAYEQLSLGKMSSNYRRDVYTYEEDVYGCYIEPIKDGKKRYTIVFYEGSLQKSGYLYEEETA